MLVLEINTFNEVFSQIEALERWHVSNIIKKNDLGIKMSTVVSSDAKFFGLLRKKSKSQRVEELNKEKRDLEANILVGDELLNLVYAHVWEKEIYTVRSMKRFRLQEIVDELSRTKVRRIKNELSFWKEMVKLRLSKDLLESEKKMKGNSKEEEEQ